MSAEKKAKMKEIKQKNKLIKKGNLKQLKEMIVEEKIKSRAASSRKIGNAGDEILSPGKPKKGKSSNFLTVASTRKIGQASGQASGQPSEEAIRNLTSMRELMGKNKGKEDPNPGEPLMTEERSPSPRRQVVDEEDDSGQKE